VSSVSGTSGLIDVSPTTGAVVVTVDPQLYGVYAGGSSVYLATTQVPPSITGAGNLAIGLDAGYYMTSGVSNVAIGSLALLCCTTGDFNVAVGQNALANAVDNTGNVAIGQNTLQNLNVSGDNSNIAIGQNAMAAVTAADSNIAIGSGALYATSGDSNVALGAYALYQTAGSSNIGIGSVAFENATGSGGYNVGIGDTVGPSIVNGANNTIIGAQCDPGADVSGVIIIGTGDGVTQIDYNNTAAGIWTLAEPLAVPGGTNPVLTTTAAVTSGAGASLGTLTNAPGAGNPTKWIPFNDNGTTRYIPAW
jgi:hypothetical protein